MMTAASIASTDMRLLLQDDVFVDFFNTFLNLPVFGQTPLYISGTGRWYLWPELPSHLQGPVTHPDGRAGAGSLLTAQSSPWATQDPSPAALLAWLEKHRLPHFCKSSLCLHLVLCQKLLAFIRSGEAAELLNWQGADQWLLERCISGSHGMRHFCAFVRGTAGEELIDFWLITERLLGLDESDGSQRELFLSLVLRLRATHLREGSSVVTLCTTIAGPLPKATHIHSISTRREILSRMQEQALLMIQIYWLPKFFVHCKMGMEEEEWCQPLLQEYQERLSQACWQEPPGLSEPFPTMHIKRSQGVSGPYCSQKAKAEVWALIKQGRDTLELKMATFRVKPEEQPGPAGSMEELCLDKDALGSIPQQSQHPAFGGRGGVTFPGRPQSSAERDLENLCKEKIVPHLPPSASFSWLPSQAVKKKPVKTLDFLPWALSAEACAGRPFRDFLQSQNRPMETHLLDLWHDLEEFLPVVLRYNRENSFFLRHLIGGKICKTYLEGNIEKLPLETRTLVSLWNHLICGEFSPWIFRAQKEICKVLCSLYEEFLAAADRMFLQFMAPGMDVPVPRVPGRAAGRGEQFYLSQRMNQSLELSQALHGTRSLEGVSSKHWQVLAAQDLQKGGSIQAEMEVLLGSAGKRRLSVPDVDLAEVQRMMSDELPVDTPSKEEELQQLMSAALKPRGGYLVPSTTAQPLPGTEIQWDPNPGVIPYQLLPTLVPLPQTSALLMPLTALDALSALPSDRFEEGDEEDEEEEEGHHQKKKTMTMQTEEQKQKQKGKQKQKQKEEQQQEEDLLPWCRKPRSRCRRHVQEERETRRMGWAWDAIRQLVRSFCKFRREMENPKCRAEFVDFLRQERRNEKENLPIKEKKKKSPSRSPRRGKAQPPKVTLIKRRILNKQLIVVNFLVDDLRFYLEMDKFSRFADPRITRKLCKAQLKRHNSFLKMKLDIISRLFLNSDIPPKLRVNISEKEKDLIHRLSSKGPLTPAIYQNAKVTLFPILMYFWRRFCLWKVMRSSPVYQEVWSSEIPEDRSPGAQKEERSSQEAQRGRSPRGHQEGRVPASSPAKSPSKEPKIPSPKKLVAIPSTTRYAPGKRPVLIFSLSEGLQLLLPRPKKQREPSEEQGDADPSGEKRPSLTGEKRPSLSGEKRPSLSEKRPSLNGEKRPSLNGEKSPSLNGEKSPSLNGEKRPSLSGEKRPSLSEKRPSLNGEKRPSLNGEKRPSLSGEKRPSLSEKRPSLNGEKRPSLNGEKRPSLNGEKRPSLSEKRPSLNGEKSPSLSGEKRPSLNGEKSPSLSGEKSPSLSKPDLQGGNEGKLSPPLSCSPTPVPTEV
ncbi:regulator of G-protein signaling protein-like [Prinia subflava]|uniref:regulator of G-protein signaling protein-like n=1 Tax=Prinia subflava TaxID=208062 RepID=UPI002FE33F36